MLRPATLLPAALAQVGRVAAAASRVAPPDATRGRDAPPVPLVVEPPPLSGQRVAARAAREARGHAPRVGATGGVVILEEALVVGAAVGPVPVATVAHPCATACVSAASLGAVELPAAAVLLAEAGARGGGVVPPAAARVVAEAAASPSAREGRAPAVAAPAPRATLVEGDAPPKLTPPLLRRPQPTERAVGLFLRRCPACAVPRQVTAARPRTSTCPAKPTPRVRAHLPVTARPALLSLSLPLDDQRQVRPHNPLSTLVALVGPTRATQRTDAATMAKRRARGRTSSDGVPLLLHETAKGALRSH